MDERELVGLLYRADWTRLTLTGTVRGSGQFPPTNPGDRIMVVRGRAGGRAGRCLWPLLGRDDGDADVGRSHADARAGEAVSAGDGGRVAGPRLRRRAGLAVAGGHSGREMADVRAQAAAAGGGAARAGLAADGLPGERRGRDDGRRAGGDRGHRDGAERLAGCAAWSTSMVLPWWELHRASNGCRSWSTRELGILLRCELAYPDETVRVTEFVGLEVGGAVDPSVFSPVAGSLFGDRPGAEDGSGRSPLEGLGGEAVKTGGAGWRRAGSARPSSTRPSGGRSVRGRDHGGAGRRDAGRRAVARVGGRFERRVGSGVGRCGGGGCGGGGADAVGDEVLDLLYRGGLEPSAVQRAALRVDGRRGDGRRHRGRGAGVGPPGGARRRRVPGRHGAIAARTRPSRGRALGVQRASRRVGTVQDRSRVPHAAGS